MAAALKTATPTMVQHAGPMALLEQPAATPTALYSFVSGVGK